MPPRKKPAPRRIVQAAAAETVTPPDALSETQAIARITGAIGNNIYTADLPSRKSLKVELATKFRSTIYMLRGTFVLIDTQEHAELDTRLDGKIINIVREDRTWRKMGYWPKEFEKPPPPEDSDDESTVGKLPPLDSDDE